MRFSERMGITQPPPLQVDSMSDSLKTALWNFAFEEYLGRKTDWQKNYALIYRYLDWTVDEVTNLSGLYSGKERVKTWYFDKNVKWYDVYNFIEFLILAQSFGEHQQLLLKRSARLVNQVLEYENSGYRFVAGQLAPITNQEEMEAVQNAASIGNQKLASVSDHIKTATSLLSQKPVPDYRNSIKESISAVESAAKLISGDKKSGLKDALDKLNEHFPIHGAMRNGFLGLYGWTSDGDGIRHGLIMDEPNVGFDEAKYMLVSCSAFVNYLVAKANETKII